jgi:hypothetical protein
MIPSSQDLLHGIARTLEQDVLPDPALSPWSASYIRSCLTLLTHLEHRVVHEGRILYQDNIDLRALLGQLRAELSAPLPETADRISATLEVTTPPSGYPSVEQLDGINQRLKSVLEKTIAAIHDGKAALGDARFEVLHARIMAYLTAANERDFIMFEQASARPPI